MNDLIRREDAIAEICKARTPDVVSHQYAELFINAVRRVPSADRPQGKWIRTKGKWIRTGRTNIYGGIEVQCPNCGDKVMVQHLEDEWYCRHCGADMGMKGADDE